MGIEEFGDSNPLDEAIAKSLTLLVKELINNSKRVSKREVKRLSILKTHPIFKNYVNEYLALTVHEKGKFTSQLVDIVKKFAKIEKNNKDNSKNPFNLFNRG